MFIHDDLSIQYIIIYYNAVKMYYILFTSTYYTSQFLINYKKKLINRV